MPPRSTPKTDDHHYNQQFNFGSSADGNGDNDDGDHGRVKCFEGQLYNVRTTLISPVMMMDDKTHARSSPVGDDDDNVDNDGYDDNTDDDDDDTDDDNITYAGSSPQTGPEDLISGYCSHLPEHKKYINNDI